VQYVAATIIMFYFANLILLKLPVILFVCNLITKVETLSRVLKCGTSDVIICPFIPQYLYVCGETHYSQFTLTWQNIYSSLRFHVQNYAYICMTSTANNDKTLHKNNSSISPATIKHESVSSNRSGMLFAKFK